MFNLQKPQLSIIIATHNSEELIEHCLKSITSQNYPREKFEIIVVDDGSTDKSVEISKNAGANKVVLTEPCSLSRARNIGVENAQSDFLAFIDSDCEARDGWVKSIIQGFREVKALSGPIYNGNPKSPVAWAEYFVEFGGFHEYRQRSKIRFMPGCNGACTREAFSKAGGFTDLRASDDVLFGESLRKVGIDSFFLPDVKISHLCRTEMKKLSSNMKLLGKYFVRTRKESPEIPYTWLISSRIFIPIIFLSKILLSAKYSIHSKKVSKFISSFPQVVKAISSFTRGVWDELAQNK